MIEYKKHTLSNGLKILINRDKTTPLVSLNILYNVGSKHEKPDMTGFAHLFEHLMFSGSVHVPDFDIPVEKAGGENNAFTNQDFTNYYITLPAVNLETAMWLESDRMLSLAFSQKKLEVQKKVVIEEFKERYLNKPYGDVFHLLYDLAYEQHHYQWPTIGKDVKHIEKATLEDVKNFFFSHYAPNNAILSLAGDVDYETALKALEKWFGDIPYREIVNPEIPEEPTQQTERRKTVEKDVPYPRLTIAYHMPGRADKNFYAHDLLSDILSNGKSARFFKHLVRSRGDIFLQADAYVTGNIDNGLFIIDATVTDNTRMEEAETLIYEELEKIRQGNVEEEELTRMKNKFESSHHFELYELSSRAFYLSYYELLGNAEFINTETGKYAEVTLKNVVETAQKLFVPSNRNVLYYLKK